MKPWKFYVAGSITFVVLALCVIMALGHGEFLMWLAGHRSVAADYYFYYVTKLGEEYGYFIVGIPFLFRHWRVGLMIALTGLAVTLVTYVLKEIFQFERPDLFLARLEWDGPMAVLDYPMLSGYASFPSGHSMAAWGLFTFLAAVVRKPIIAVMSLFFAISVSISRVYLMAHFLRDVAVGAAIGFLVGYLLFYVYDTKLKIKDIAW